MSIHLTRIYTKTGDDGTTNLGDMSRVPKTDSRLAAYGTVDETNSAIGVALSLGQLSDDLRSVLLAVQNDLFDVGADLSTPLDSEGEQSRLRITQDYVTRLEDWCDRFNAELPKLTSFVLPGGSPGAALLHTARTIARRAERHAWEVAHIEPDAVNPVAIQYLNRLSDLLFILARRANPSGDLLWQPGENR